MSRMTTKGGVLVMCQSPDELSDERIEELIREIEDEIAKGRNVNSWTWRKEMFKELLAERALVNA